jgi:cell division protein FtsL
LKNVAKRLRNFTKFQIINDGWYNKDLLFCLLLICLIVIAIQAVAIAYLFLRKVCNVPRKNSENSRPECHDEPEECQVEKDVCVTVEEVGKL